MVNGERAQVGLPSITEDQLERVIEQLELHCWDKIQTIMKNEEGLGIEYDENVICDVCRSPDSEEGNEMVFCDSCNICVHQACYGIMTIPAGQWLCCTCSLGQRPDCVLCPNKGGAMKSTRSGHKWAHVSCALWIPEVSIGCVEKMEPITKISSIPQSRWALICVLCRERVGACIQCSVKTCKTAYHVTCAFKHGLEMRAIIEDENADDGVKLRSYCQKHSVSSKKEKSVCSGSEDDDSKRKKRKDMTSEEKNQARAARLQEIEAEFDKHVSVKDIMQLEVDSDGLHYIYNYWKLKRRSGHNKPLLPPKSEDVDMLSHKQEQADLEKMKMFVQLRQDLERVRNLCYMVSRREKLSRSFFRLREQTFHKQAAVLSSAGHTMNANAITAIIEANHGPSIYDRLYSHSKSEDHTLNFETILARIAGYKSPAHDSGDDRKSTDLNGIIKDRKLNNPYKRLYFNGSSKRRSASLYGSSLSSASSSSEVERKPDINNSSTENEKPSSSVIKKKATRVRKTSESVKAAERRKNRLNSLVNKIKSESSSEEDEKPVIKDWSKSRTLRRMEQELGDKNASCTDSDEFMPVRLDKHTENVKPAAIYSDSDTSDSSTKNEDKSSNAASDSQQNKLKTKASVKEFSLLSKPQAGSAAKGAATKKKVDETDGKKDTSVKKELSKKKEIYDPSDLIVPQRQAAKKASENLKSTTSRSKEPVSSSVPDVEVKTEKSVPEEKEKPKTKSKVKPTKETKDNKEKDSKKENITKVGGKTPDVFDIDKEFDKEDNQEILAYVPQRQAAKKAAEHIKSGLGKPVATEQIESDVSRNKKDLDKDTKAKQKDSELIKSSRKDQDHDVKSSKKETEKVAESKRKSSVSSSSSSSSSSTTSTSSSSDSEEDIPPIKKSQPLERLHSESILSSSLSDNSKRNSTKDWPFLDKSAKSAVITPSSSSESSHSPQSSPRKVPPTKGKPDNKTKTSVSRVPKAEQPAAKHEDSSTKLAGKKFRRVADKKLKTSDKQPEPEIKPAAVEREEPSRHPAPVTKTAKSRTRTKRQSNASDRIRDADVRPGDITDSQRVSVESKPAESSVQSPKKEQQAKSAAENRKRKSDEMGRDVSTSSEQSRVETTSRAKTEKESIKSSKLSSPVRKTDKKLTDKVPEKVSAASSQLSNLEKEIMERKAGRDLNTKKTSKSTLDKLFEKRDKKLDKQVTVQPVKENKEPSEFDAKFENIINKSPAKHKHDDIPVTKFNATDLDHLSEKAQKEKSSPRYKKPEPLPARLKKQAEENKAAEIEKQKSIQQEMDITNQNIPSETKHEPEKIELSRRKSPEKPPTQGYSNRSIFSPQPIKDSACTEIFDFDNAMLNVDEAANDDGFSLPREDDGARAPLSFTYAGSELLFKEDSKEDSARETLNLVEKLRMELSKKSTGTGHNDGPEEQLEINKKEETEKTDVRAEEVNSKVADNKEVTKEQEVHAEVSEQVPAYTDNESNYHYSSCGASVHMELNKTAVPAEESHHTDHGVSTQADERWVPPSDPFPVDIPHDKIYNDTHLQLEMNKHSFIHPPELNSQECRPPDVHTADIHSSDIQQADLHPPNLSSSELHQQDMHEQINALPKHNLMLPEEMHKEPSPVTQERLPQHTPFIEPASMDCMPSPSPYAEMHQQAKWADSQVMPARRSSSSSADSSSSSVSQRNEDIEMSKREEMMIGSHPGLITEMPFGMLTQGKKNNLLLYFKRHFTSFLIETFCIQIFNNFFFNEVDIVICVLFATHSDKRI